MNSGLWLNFQPRPRAPRQDVAEQLLGFLPAEEVRLVRGALIGVAGRGHDAIDAERHGVVEEFRGALGVGAVEQGAVDGKAEAARLGGLDGFHGAIEHALLVHRRVVRFAVAVEVDVPAEIGVGFVLVELLFEQQGVGAEIDELLPLQDAAHDLRQLLVQQGLAAGDGDDRGAAFVDGVECVLDRQALVQDLVRVVDLAAAGAGQVAAEQRLEHQHQRVSLTAGQMLPDHIGADPHRLH